MWWLPVALTVLACEGVKAEPFVEISTSEGPITIELYPDKAPKTVEAFLKNVRSGYYAGTVFHRAISRFMVQGGGLTADLVEKPAPTGRLPSESSNGLQNDRGMVAMARGADPNSATTQFFINLVDNPVLNYKGSMSPDSAGYTVFGAVVKGMDVVDKIGAAATQNVGPYSNVPMPLVTILKAQVSTPQGVQLAKRQPAAVRGALSFAQCPATYRSARIGDWGSYTPSAPTGYQNPEAVFPIAHLFDAIQQNGNEVTLAWDWYDANGPIPGRETLRKPPYAAEKGMLSDLQGKPWQSWSPAQWDIVLAAMQYNLEGLERRRPSQEGSALVAVDIMQRHLQDAIQAVRCYRGVAAQMNGSGSASMTASGPNSGKANPTPGNAQGSAGTGGQLASGQGQQSSKVVAVGQGQQTSTADQNIVSINGGSDNSGSSAVGGGSAGSTSLQKDGESANRCLKMTDNRDGRAIKNVCNRAVFFYFCGLDAGKGAGVGVCPDIGGARLEPGKVMNLTQARERTTYFYGGCFWPYLPIYGKFTGNRIDGMRCRPL
ncbi:peptidylprolyl isomerase [Ralstonia mannitolilytica]|uniref:peptidylprolyl isomerase n=1 Tax=Ralstonia mannitolilytica TaxID=105219 RepID=UPI002930AA55|nr:peptidylprolyl isomerase [Ralstonia mannitolilytica]